MLLPSSSSRRPALRATLARAGVVAALVVPLAAVPALVASAADGPELIPNGTFDDGATAPWWTTPDLTADGSTGALCVDVPGGTPSAWSSIVGIDDVPLVQGESYRFTFKASGTAPAPIRALVQMNQAPWDATSEINPVMNPELTPYDVGFTSTMDWPKGQVVFQVGGADEAWTFCLDDVSLHTGAPPAPYEAETGPTVRVNQYGYTTRGPKNATVVTDAAQPLDWTLRDAQGAEVATGVTVPRGVDDTAGAAVHTVSFTDVEQPGEGYTLVVDGAESYPFAIGGDLYGPLTQDALHYFYLARSGIEIDAAHAGLQYARAAGHLQVAPNQGDLQVGCQAPQLYYQGWTCDATFDVHGGWYDAGDHGKYVVNGGIAVHQLLDVWERASARGGADDDARAAAEAGALKDGSAQIPEAGNGVPDVLDEARWELEWMARMQVPAGQQYAGMVFHKLHDDEWTGLPLLPADDAKKREVHRPSTAATYNFAAVAAKGARLWEPYDAGFAASLLDAARTAWDAAHANPVLLALPQDGVDGGGPYDDKDVTDEEYWAAAELYLTTKEAPFAAAVQASPWNGESLLNRVSFDWQRTAALGAIDLARVDNEFTTAAAAAVEELADFQVDRQRQAFFGQVYQPSDALYEWGSNGIILNNVAVVATAYDLTGDEAYRSSALESLDYLLGRNALNNSYVTGYGTQFSQNQHHRWMAAELDPDLPHPSKGTVAGGPNSDIQDPVAKATWPQGCVAQLCYLDRIQSWSTNEMTVNWNSALTWVAAWADDAAGAPLATTDESGSAASSTSVWLGVGALVVVLVGGVVAAVVVSRRRARRRPAE